MKRNPGAGDGGRARAAVRLHDVAVDGDLPLAERLEIDDGAERPPDQALNLERAPALVPDRRLAPHPFVRGARQHAVFRRDPALAAAAKPARHLFGDARRAQHLGIAEAHQARAFGVLGDGAVERDGAQLIQ